MLAYLLAISLVSSPLPEKIETAVKNYVQTNFEVSQAEYQFDFSRVSYSILPPECDSVKVLRIGKKSPIGNTVFSLGIYKDDKLSKTTSVTVGVSALVNALVATIPIRTGEQFHDLAFAKRAIMEEKEFPVTDSTLLHGKQAITYIPSGSMIMPTMFDTIPIIKLGDKVGIVVDRGLVRVMARGIAREKGGKGDCIRVANLDSKKIIVAEIIDSLTVACK
jgi:flagella basal body P-ring formation protein FlgA